MPEERSAQAEAPEKERKATDEQERNRERGRRDQIVFVEPAEFGKFCEVGDVVVARVHVFIGNDPADVRPKKSKEGGRVKIVLLVGVTMMMAVMSGPPEDTLLRGGLRHERNNELKEATGLVRAM